MTVTEFSNYESMSGDSFHVTEATIPKICCGKTEHKYDCLLM